MTYRDMLAGLGPPPIKLGEKVAKGETTVDVMNELWLSIKDQGPAFLTIYTEAFRTEGSMTQTHPYQRYNGSMEGPTVAEYDCKWKQAGVGLRVTASGRKEILSDTRAAERDFYARFSKREPYDSCEASTTPKVDAVSIRARV